MVTVSYEGGPSDSLNVFAALRAWLTPGDAVVPSVELFEPGQSQQSVTRQDTTEMLSSQQIATAAALCQLRIPFVTVDTVSVVEQDMPARGVLKIGDVIEAVDGTPVTCKSDAGDLISSHAPGSVVTLTVLRRGVRRRIRIKAVAYQGRAAVGVEIAESYRDLPFSVKIRVGNIGGPSAGLMFALGIIDKLTPESLTHGNFIAGTGEMVSANGAIGPIGGIQQKMVAARDAGATIFLTPAANCSDTEGATPAGLRLIKVSTLAEAVADLHALVLGKPVPGC